MEEDMNSYKEDQPKIKMMMLMLIKSQGHNNTVSSPPFPPKPTENPGDGGA